MISIIILTIFSWVLKPDIKYVHDLSSIHIKLPYPTIPIEILNVNFLLITLFYGLMMAIVAIVQTTLTARMMDEVTDTTSDKNRESIGQGIANLVVGLFGGYGGSALVGQSRFNVTMGANSRVSTLVTGSFTGKFICFGEIIGHIPMAVLATVLITISLNTFDRRTIPFIRKSPLVNGFMVILTMVLILISNNLALGVVIVTILYYIFKRFINLERT